MKKLLFGIIVGLLAGGTAAWLFLRGPAAEDHAEATAEKKEELRVQHGTNGETFVKLDAAAQARAGLKLVALAAAELEPELKAYGRVLDPSPLVTALTDIAAARAQLEATKKEAQRLRTLFNQNQNASARALETAEAALQRDELLARAAEVRLKTSWGLAVEKRAFNDGFMQSLVSQESALVRLDLPASQKLEGDPKAARVSLLSAPDRLLDAEFVGPALTADPQTLSRGFLFLVQAKELSANAALTGWLVLSGPAEKGVIVPRDAIVRHEGEAFVYVQTGAETFVRAELELEHPVEKGWFTEALKPGTKVVVSGAQQLLSEEFKGEGGGE